MYVQELWRYLVKSMRGERVLEATMEQTGIKGYRNIVVVSQVRHRIVTARTHPGLLGLQASIAADGRTLIEDHIWNSPPALAMTQKAAGEPVRLVEAGTRPERFDVLPLLVATDGAIQELDLDLRRLPRRHCDWRRIGPRQAKLAGCELIVWICGHRRAQLRSRCVMTTFDPDTLEQDLGILRTIVRRAESKPALDCAVVSPGVLHVDDAIFIRPKHKGHF